MTAVVRAGAADDPSAPDPVLQVIVSDSVHSVTRAELEKKMAPAEMTVYSPVYQRLMTYQGFWLDEILSVLSMHLSEEEDLVFLCEDGYGTSLPAAGVGAHRWLVAFGERGGWTPLPERNVPTLPGPWYVVGRDTSSYQEFPWPYQIVTIKIHGGG